MHSIAKAPNTTHTVYQISAHGVAHARTKYLRRRYSDGDLAKCWHDNRVIVTRENLKIKSIPELRRIEGDPAKYHSFDLSMPLKSHFWQW